MLFLAFALKPGEQSNVMTKSFFDWDDLFLSAALEPDYWVAALRTMAEQCGASRGQLIGIGKNRAIPFN